MVGVTGDTGKYVESEFSFRRVDWITGKSIGDAVNSVYRQHIFQKIKSSKRTRNSSDTLNSLSLFRAGNRRGAEYIEYLRCFNPAGKFINFCGLCVNTESLLVGLGLNLNTEEYISVCSMKDIINLTLFGTVDSDILGDEDFLYLLESWKIFSDKFDAKDYVSDLIRESSNTVEFTSIILNCVKRKELEYSDDRRKYFSMFSSSEDILKAIVSSCVYLADKLESLSFTLFGNMIVESGVSDFLMVSNKQDGSFKLNLEALRSKYLSLGFNSLFLDGLISYGFGKNKRRSLLSAVMGRDGFTGKNHVETFLSLSSMSYVEIYKGGDVLGSINIKKSQCYNLLELIRSTGWDQDLFFSYEVLLDFKNEIMLKSVLGRFGFSEILDELGITLREFSEYALQYRDRFCVLLDTGAMYSRRVRMSQYQLGAFSGKMLSNSGRLFKKMSGRIIKKF